MKHAVPESRCIRFLAITVLALLSSTAHAEMGDSPQAGLYNGFLGQTNVVECVNAGPAPISARMDVRTESGALLGSRVFTVSGFGTGHIILNEFEIADRYGSY
ncbi:MAG: hypothetical protein KDD44_04085 [Bdellovibrionales bacterium]|nr:hypothetical protein [Bdellovibrionales bacterium]